MCSPNSCLLLNVRDDTGIHVIVDQSSSHSRWKCVLHNYLSTMIINSCISGFRCFTSILPYNLKSCWHTRAKAKVLLGAVNPPPQSWVLSLWVLSLQKQCLLFRKPMQQHWGWQKAFMPSSSWKYCFLLFSHSFHFQCKCIFQLSGGWAHAVRTLSRSPFSVGYHFWSTSLGSSQSEPSHRKSSQDETNGHTHVFV